jgi:hypothetical protein
MLSYFELSGVSFDGFLTQSTVSGGGDTLSSAGKTSSFGSFSVSDSSSTTGGSVSSSTLSKSSAAPFLLATKFSVFKIVSRTYSDASSGIECWVPRDSSISFEIESLVSPADY